MSEKRGSEVFIPVLNVSGESLPEAWENAYFKIHDEGLDYIRFDKKDHGRLNLDSFMVMEVKNPDADPFSHLAGGTNANEAPLLDYYMEIMGAKPGKWWIRDFTDSTDMRWEYTYEACAKEYGAYLPGQVNDPKRGINQLDIAVQKLINDPSTRKAQAITWDPRRDTTAEHTPCLQRIQFLLMYDCCGKPCGIDMHYNFRSRNVANASFGNMQGLYLLGCDVRDRVEEAHGCNLAMRILDVTDSFHVNANELPKYREQVANTRKRMAKGESWENFGDRTQTRADVIYSLEGHREKVEADIVDQTVKYSSDVPRGDIERHVHGVADRIFYLLNKYAPKKNGD